MKLGNTKLVPYGIQNEESDYRIHVCPLVKCIYIFATDEGRRAARNKIFRKVPVYTGAIKTAEGKLVPPAYIEGCSCVHIPEGWWEDVSIKEEDTTTVKGEKAVSIAARALKAGKLPIPAPTKEVVDEDLQIDGVDIVIPQGLRFQVKCDYRGGSSDLGGTGNLFLQTAECNPLQQV